jgi:hypothetical protein
MYWWHGKCTGDTVNVLETWRMYWRHGECTGDTANVLETRRIYWRHGECTGGTANVLETRRKYRRHGECTGDTANLLETRRIRAQLASHRILRAEDRVQLHVNPRAIYYHTPNRNSKIPRATLRLHVILERTHCQKQKTNGLKAKEINLLIETKSHLSIENKYSYTNR